MPIPKAICHDSYFKMFTCPCVVFCVENVVFFHLEPYFRDEETALEEPLVLLILVFTDFIQV